MQFLGRLSRQGLIERVDVRTLGMELPSRPLWTSKAGPPPYSKIEYVVRSRFRDDVRTEAIYVASRQGAALLGGKSGKTTMKKTQVSHDLHVASVWLRKFLHKPSEARDWRGEDTYAVERKGEKLPDAMCFADGMPYLVVESAGISYTAERIEAFVNDCRTRKLEWELW